MIFPRNCYFYCDTEAEVKELLQMLEDDGLRWSSGDRLTSKLLRYPRRTYYRVRITNRVTYGGRSDNECDWPTYSIDDARGFYNCTAAPVTIPDINDFL